MPKQATTSKVLKPSSKHNAPKLNAELLKSTLVQDSNPKEATAGHPDIQWPLTVIKHFSKLVHENRNERYQELNKLTPEALSKISAAMTQEFPNHAELFSVADLEKQLDYIVKLYLFYYLPSIDLKFEYSEESHHLEWNYRFKDKASAKYKSYDDFYWDAITNNLYIHSRKFGIRKLGKESRDEFKLFFEADVEYVYTLKDFVDDLQTQAAKRVKYLEKKFANPISEVGNLRLRSLKLILKKPDDKTEEDEQNHKEINEQIKVIEMKYKDEFKEIDDSKRALFKAKVEAVIKLIDSPSWRSKLTNREINWADMIFNDDFEEEYFDEILNEKTNKKKFETFRRILGEFM